MIGLEKNKKKYDENGKFAKLGKTNKIILNQALDNFNYKKIKVTYHLMLMILI